MAGTTRLELATSDVTGRRSNQTELRPRKMGFGSFIRCAHHTFSVVGGTGIEPVTFGL